MAAGVSLKKATEAVGHGRYGGTKTSEIIKALRSLGLECGDRCERISRKRPNLPRRGIVVLHRPKEPGKRKARWHWMLTWDGTIYDPAGMWPDNMRDWRMTSYLRIHER